MSTEDLYAHRIGVQPAMLAGPSQNTLTMTPDDRPHKTTKRKLLKPPETKLPKGHRIVGCSLWKT